VEHILNCFGGHNEDKILFVLFRKCYTLRIGLMSSVRGGRMSKSDVKHGMRFGDTGVKGSEEVVRFERGETSKH